MEKIHALTFGFNKKEDRLILTCRLGGAQPQPLWITRHLAFALLQGLGRLLQKDAAPPAADPRIEATYMSMTHARALHRVDQRRAGKAPPAPADAPLPPRLLTEIRIGKTREKRRLRFLSEGSAVGYLDLDAAQLHWFVNRLARFCHDAGWGRPIPSPEWIEPEDAGQTVPAGVPVH